jgi:hypothetical protein
MRQKKEIFYQRHRAKDLGEIWPGDTVWIPDQHSVMDGAIPSPRSHTVQTADGTYRRNRQHLVRIPENESTQEAENEIEPQDSEQPSRTRSTRTSRPPERYDQVGVTLEQISRWGRCGIGHSGHCYASILNFEFGFWLGTELDQQEWGGA